MLSKTILPLTAAVLVAATLSAESKASTPADTAMNAWGGRAAFENLGVIKLEVKETVKQKGKSQEENEYTLYFDTQTGQRRQEIPSKNLVLAGNKNNGWATINGKLDDRPQTTLYVPRMTNEVLFPFLLPFSLTFNGVTTTPGASSSKFAGTDAHVLIASISPKFFMSPLINTRWGIFLDPTNNYLIGAGFPPTPGYDAVKANLGMQYVVKETTVVNGVRLPALIEIDAVDSAGNVMGIHRSTRIKVSVPPDISPVLFLHPDKVRELDER